MFEIIVADKIMKPYVVGTWSSLLADKVTGCDISEGSLYFPLKGRKAAAITFKLRKNKVTDEF